MCGEKSTNFSFEMLSFLKLINIQGEMHVDTRVWNLEERCGLEEKKTGVVGMLEWPSSPGSVLKSLGNKLIINCRPKQNLKLL